MAERGELAGVCVLIVEDRYLIASELADEIRSLGGEVIGPAGNLARGAALLSERRPDLALLDVNLDGELVFPLAADLEAQRTPIVFLTGYEDDVLPERWRDRPRLTKPVSVKLLRQTLSRVLEPGGED